MIVYVFKLLSGNLLYTISSFEPWADRGGAVRSAVRSPRPNRAKSVAASGWGRLSCGRDHYSGQSPFSTDPLPLPVIAVLRNMGILWPSLTLCSPRLCNSDNSWHCASIVYPELLYATFSSSLIVGDHCHVSSASPLQLAACHRPACTIG
uniref:Uncharacterized protein n=1 Tax=Ananas comosus var. bracteatus TaxID=296719 RepID=A0A6V7PEI2_ANACO|nr:unnamed protein product [Ananas comosus var. bracteatus]